MQDVLLSTWYLGSYIKPPFTMSTSRLMFLLVVISISGTLDASNVRRNEDRLLESTQNYLETTRNETEELRHLIEANQQEIDQLKNASGLHPIWCPWRQLGGYNSGSIGREPTWQGMCNFKGKDNARHPGTNLYDEDYADSYSHESYTRFVRLCECPAPLHGGKFCKGPDIRDVEDCCLHHGSDTSDFDVTYEWKSFNGSARGLTCPGLPAGQRRRKRHVQNKIVQHDQNLKTILERVDDKLQENPVLRENSEYYVANPNELNKAFTIGKDIIRKGKNISLDQIIALHRVITEGDTKANTGKVRSNVVIFQLDDTIIDYPSPFNIGPLMESFVNWLNTESGLHPVVKASATHFQLVNIHPFRNGNGRTARLLMNLLLDRAGYPTVFIAREDRERYNSLLGDYMATRDPNRMETPTMEYMLPFIQFIAENLEANVDTSPKTQDYRDMHNA